MSSQTKKSAQAIAVLYAGSASITLFWVLVIMKAAFKPVKNFLDFYSPVGPLLGVFVAAILMFVVAKYLIAKYFEENHKGLNKKEDRAILVYIVSVVLFVFMVFPPIFEPIAHWL